MIGPKKPHFITGFIVNSDELSGENSFVATFYLTEEYKKKLKINEPIFFNNFIDKISSSSLTREEKKEVYEWVTSIISLQSEIELYFPIKRLIPEVQ